MVLSVASAPVALQICQVTCESKATPPPMSHTHVEGHGAHHHMPANDHARHERGGAPQLSPGSVPCDHGTDTTPSLAAAKNSDVSLSLLAILPLHYSIATVDTRDVRSLSERVVANRLAIPRIVPLRV
jgi:hypothetical protein